MDYNNIIIALQNRKYKDEEYENIINICKKKQEEMTNEYYSNKIYEIKSYFVNELTNFNFYKKMSDTLISFNIKFNYKFFIITLSNRKSYCVEFGGISIENNINIIDTNNENCYNLFGSNMLKKFLNIINLDISEQEIKNIINYMFQIYQPEELIKW